MILSGAGVISACAHVREDRTYRAKAVRLCEEVTEAVRKETELPEGTVGILRIPALSVECPVADSTETDILQTHAGLIEGSDVPGTSGGNTAIAAHSARNGFLCSFCWFQKIAELKQGDEISLLYRDGRTYPYAVYEVMEGLFPEDPEPFQREEGREILTLQTCTQGSPVYRTYVHAERIA